MKKTVLQLLLLLFFFVPFTFAQSAKENKFLHKWAIGGGYNFLNNSGFPDDREKPFDKRTFELSVKYRLTDKHSFYLMVPLYVDCSSKKRKYHKTNDIIPSLHRIWGTDLGYNYAVFDWKGIRVFGGMGFSYLHSKRDIKYLTDWDGNKWTDHFFLKKKYNGYGLSPQVGIAYRFQHVECELKYKYSLFRMKSDVRWIESDGSVDDVFGGKQYYFESLHGLSIGLFYYF